MSESDCKHGQRPRVCEICALEAERDRALRLLADVRFVVYPYEGTIDDDEIGLINYTDLPAAVAGIIDERDRLRASVVLGNGLAGTMRRPSDPSQTHAWFAFKQSIADLVTDGMLEEGEGL